MLRIIQSANVKAAKSYYVSGLSREDYYSEEQEIIGYWGGLAAERLGLSGQVSKEGFEALCNNRNPATGEQLTVRQKDNRTVGYDFNFHCPKSVSAVYALTQDEAILSAFRVAVRETMQEIEADMQTRVRKHGAAQDRVTGNLAYGEFVHFTARPVEGVPDPHLHAHCFVFNVTHDAAEDRWKAGQFRELKRDGGYYEATFHSRLSNHMTGLGYGVERTAKSWELAGVPQSVVEKFSRRTAEIEAVAAANDITDAKKKDALGARTRSRKQKDLTMETLRADWRARLTDNELIAVEGARHWATREAITLAEIAPATDWTAKDMGMDFAHRPVPTTQPITEKAAMDYALEHSFERQSVVSDRELMAAALRHGVGSVTVEGIKQEARRSEIVKQKLDGGRVFTTTKGVLAEEKACLEYVKIGRGAFDPLGKKTFVFEPGRLNEEQQAAVRHALTSKDQHIGIRGGAGVGKTTLMREAIRGIEEGGKKVFVLAPGAEASRGVLRDEGFKNAETVAAFLKEEKAGRYNIAGQVIWIDEAGTMGARQMKEVLQRANTCYARVILSGDVRQHGSVERGDALRLLEDKGGLRTAQVNEIQRQKGIYKEAVGAVSRGDLATAFERLDKMGAIIEREGDQRYTELAHDYVTAKQAGKTVLAVSPTHAEGQKVTDAIRAEMKKAGALDAKGERSVTRLENLQFTEAQKKDARNYALGQVVQFSTDAPNIKRGSKLRVSKIEGNRVIVTDEYGGKPRDLPMDKAGRFQVYQERHIELAKGDRVRITQNGFTAPPAGRKEGHRLNNGAMYEVAAVSMKGDIKLTNGWTVPKNFGHINHGYCATSHASQGKTVDRVFVAQGSASLSASSREQFYVSLSRGRESVRIYTDNKAALKEAVGVSNQRMSATELTQRRRSERLRGAVKQQVERVQRGALIAKTHAVRTVSVVKREAERQRQTQAQKQQQTAKPRRQPQKGMEYER